MLNIKLLVLLLPIHLVSCQDDSSNESSEIVALEQSTIDEQSAQPLSLRGGKLISDYPAIVGIGNDQARSCTGTVFTMNDSGKTCLLTAAHCVNPEETSIWLGGDEKREYIPVLSDWKLDISNSRKLNQLDIAAIPIVPRVSVPRARLQSFGQHNLAPNEGRISDRVKDGNSAVEIWGFGRHYDTVGKKEVIDGKKRTGTASFISFVNQSIKDPRFINTRFIKFGRGQSGEMICPGDSGGPLMIGGTIYGINSAVYTRDENRCELSNEGVATSIGHYPSTVKDALSLACGACPSRPLSEKFMDLHPAVFDDSLTVKYSLNGRAANDKDKLFGIRLIPLNVEAKQSTWDVRGSGNAGDVLTEIHWLPNSQALDLSHSELNWQGPPSFNPTKFNLKPGSKWEAVLMSRCSPATAPVILDIIRFEVKDPNAVTCVDDSAPGTSLCSNLTIPNAPVIVAPIANGVQNPGVQFQFQSSDPSSHNVTTHYELWAASLRQKVWHTRFTTGVRANDTWSPTMGRTSRFTDVYTSPMWFVPKVGDEIEFQVRACADNQVNSTLPRKCSRWTKKRVIYQSPSGTPRVTVGVTKVGDGSVLFQPSGDVCDSRCSSRFQTYATGTNVTLTASPLSFFRSWDNCPSGNSNAVCTLGSVNASKSLTATFGRPCDLQKSVDIGGKTDISIGCFATRVIVKIPQYCNHRIANIKVFPWQVFDLKTQNVSAFVQRTFTSPSPQQVDSVEVTLNRAWGCRVEIQAFY